MDFYNRLLQVGNIVRFPDSDDWDSRGEIIRISPSGRYSEVQPEWENSEPFWEKSKNLMLDV